MTVGPLQPNLCGRVFEFNANSINLGTWFDCLVYLSWCIFHFNVFKTFWGSSRHHLCCVCCGISGKMLFTCSHVRCSRLHSYTRLTSVNPVFMSNLWLFEQNCFLSLPFSITAAICWLQRSRPFRSSFTHLFIKIRFIVSPAYPNDRRGRVDIQQLWGKDLLRKTLRQQLITLSGPGLLLTPNLQNALWQ